MSHLIIIIIIIIFTVIITTAAAAAIRCPSHSRIRTAVYLVVNHPPVNSATAAAVGHIVAARARRRHTTIGRSTIVVGVIGGRGVTCASGRRRFNVDHSILANVRWTVDARWRYDAAAALLGDRCGGFRVGLQRSGGHHCAGRCEVLGAGDRWLVLFLLALSALDHRVAVVTRPIDDVLHTLSGGGEEGDHQQVDAKRQLYRELSGEWKTSS